MTGLRQGCVEAMAEAAFMAYFGDDEEMAPFDLTEWRPVAEAVLDRMLAFLSTNAEAWWEAKANRYMSNEMYRAGSDGEANVLGLIAALRITIEEET